MGNEVVEKILATRHPTSVNAGSKYYSVSASETPEQFLEFQIREGMRCCFSYTDLDWFNFDPEEGCLDLTFGGFLITVKGRGLAPGLFEAIKSKRAEWIKESDSEEEDNPQNKIFVASIRITPPSPAGPSPAI